MLSGRAILFLGKLFQEIPVTGTAKGRRETEESSEKVIIIFIVYTSTYFITVLFIFSLTS
jgi:hypothetical protein